MSQPSEYEYAEISVWNKALGSSVAVWSREGWDVVTASYGGGTSCSTDSGQALLRRKRGGDWPPPPGTITSFTQHGAQAHAERSSGGEWMAWRICGCGCGQTVANAYWFMTEGEVREALERRRANEPEIALWLAGKRAEAWEVLRAREDISLSGTDGEWLFHEIDPTHKPEFSLR